MVHHRDHQWSSQKTQIINPLINQSTNQATNQATNQSTNLPTNLPTNQPTNLPTNQSINQATNQSSPSPHHHKSIPSISLPSLSPPLYDETPSPPSPLSSSNTAKRPVFFPPFPSFSTIPMPKKPFFSSKASFASSSGSFSHSHNKKRPISRG